MNKYLVLASILGLSICLNTMLPFNDGYALAKISDNEEWKLLSMTNPPPSRYCHIQIYDTKRNIITIFGGWHYEANTNTYTMYDDTWQADLTSHSWKKIETDTHPSSRGSYAILDSCNDRIILFGGYAMFGNKFFGYNDLWQFDLDSLKWTQLFPEGTCPQNIGDYLIYDPIDRRVILFGGETINPPYEALNETWALELDSLKWRKLNTIGSLPQARWGHGGVYDSVKHRMIIFGGKYEENNNLKYLRDLWELDLDTLEWKEIIYPFPFPRARAAMAMILDPLNNRLIVYGGETSGNGSISDLREFNLNTKSWKRLSPTGEIPAGRSWIIGNYDRIQHRMLIFGGNKSFTEMLNDTYELLLPKQSTLVTKKSYSISDFLLEQNYPNPFNPTTELTYQIPKKSKVSLGIYNTLGSLVKELVNDYKSAGKYTLTWDGRDENGKMVAGGLYLCRMLAGNYTKTRKMIFLR